MKKLTIIILVGLILAVTAGPARSAWIFERLTDNAGISKNPAMAVSGSSVFVVWEDRTYATPEIFFKRATDGGSSWSFERLTDNSGDSLCPAVAVSGSNGWVVWQDD